MVAWSYQISFDEDFGQPNWFIMDDNSMELLPLWVCLYVFINLNKKISIFITIF